MPAWTQTQNEHGHDGARLPTRIATTIDAVIISWADYVSHCKLCGLVVLRSHAWHWSTKPMGIVHDDGGCP